MGNISKSYGHDASKNKPTPRVRYVNGERRLEKAPLGIRENWVDGQGNVVWLQLRKAGDVPDQGIIDRNRAQYRRDGWVEHNQCPLTNGAMRSGKIAKDLDERPAELRDACSGDPKTLVRTDRGIEYRPACPHVEWLIGMRRQREAERVALKRGSRVASAADMQAQMLAETKKANELMVEAVKSIAGGRKAKSE